MTTPRIKNPASYLPDAMQPLMTLGKLPPQSGIPESTLELVHLRVSQINGCAWCLDMGVKNAPKTGITDSQLAMLAGWRDAYAFSPAECAALDLAEHMTRFADQSDPVPDPIWDAAAEHFEEKQLAALVLHVATVNLYNRMNVTVRQQPGRW